MRHSLLQAPSLSTSNLWNSGPSCHNANNHNPSSANVLKPLLFPLLPLGVSNLKCYLIEISKELRTRLTRTNQGQGPGPRPKSGTTDETTEKCKEKKAKAATTQQVCIIFGKHEYVVDRTQWVKEKKNKINKTTKILSRRKNNKCTKTDPVF